MAYYNSKSERKKNKTNFLKMMGIKLLTNFYCFGCDCSLVLHGKHQLDENVNLNVNVKGVNMNKKIQVKTVIKYCKMHDSIILLVRKITIKNVTICWVTIS